VKQKKARKKCIVEEIMETEFLAKPPTPVKKSVKQLFDPIEQLTQGRMTLSKDDLHMFERSRKMTKLKFREARMAQVAGRIQTARSFASSTMTA